MPPILSLIDYTGQPVTIFGADGKPVEIIGGGISVQAPRARTFSATGRASIPVGYLAGVPEITLAALVSTNPTVKKLNIRKLRVFAAPDGASVLSQIEFSMPWLAASIGVADALDASGMVSPVMVPFLPGDAAADSHVYQTADFSTAPPLTNPSNIHSQLIMTVQGQAMLAFLTNPPLERDYTAENTGANLETSETRLVAMLRLIGGGNTADLVTKIAVWWTIEWEEVAPAA